MEPRLYPPDC